MLDNPRRYGRKPFKTAVLHGGPGAPGEMAPVARELAKRRGVLELLQRAGSVDGQVLELAGLLEKSADGPVALIGWSWGAWLAWCLTAEYPLLVDKPILVAAPPFEERYVASIMATRRGRLSPARARDLLSLVKSLENPLETPAGEAMVRLHDIFLETDSLDMLPYQEEVPAFQYGVYRDVWAEASLLRSSGHLLELGKRIHCPVVALHGDYDPHPADGVSQPLSRVLVDFRFVLLAGCGHYPWLERNAREEFFSLLEVEL